MKINPHFGYYKASGIHALIIKLSRLGFGHGKLKKFLFKCWKKRNPKCPVDIIYHGIKLRLEPQYNTIEKNILFSPNLREAKELNYLSPYLENGGLFIDIGANMGYYSLMAAKQGADQILAIEPNPVLCERLSRMATLNNLNNIIDVANTGLGETNDSLLLTLNPFDLGSSSMVDKNMLGDKIKVPIITLPNLLNEKNIKQIDALKIDVEGMEDKILFPYFESVSNNFWPKLIIIEENDKFWKRNIIEWLLSNKYQKVDQTRGNLILKND